MSARTASLFPLVTALAACGATPVPSIQARAAADFSCDAAKVTVKPMGPSARGADKWFPYSAEGCGETGRYFARCSPLGLCSEPQGEVVSQLVRKQASFDLGCGPTEVAIAALNADTFGARGCGKQASYIVLDCDRNSGCRVVQNTQAQH